MATLFKSNYLDFDMSGFIDKLKEIITKDTVIVNIGSDRNIQDSLAPLVGTLLKENNFNLPVYGTIESPIHALNIVKRMEDICNKHPHANIIGIDACASSENLLGEIRIQDVPIKAGAGMGKSLPRVGRYSIVGLNVDEKELDIFIHKSTTRLYEVFTMAKKIAEGLIKASQYIEVNEVASDILDEEIKIYRVS